MNLSGKSISSWDNLAPHLLNSIDNEEATPLWGTWPLLRWKLRAYQALSLASSRAKRGLYHVSVNVRRPLTDEELRQTVLALSSPAGLDLNRNLSVAVKHIKHGREHYHVVIPRYRHGRLAPCHHDWPTCQKVASILCRRLDLPHEPRTDGDGYRHPDNRAALHLTGLTMKEHRANADAAWSTGTAFVQTLEGMGYGVLYRLPDPPPGDDDGGRKGKGRKRAAWLLTMGRWKFPIRKLLPQVPAYTLAFRLATARPEIIERPPMEPASPR